MIKLFIHKHLRTLFDNYTYITKNGLARGMLRRGGLGFIPSFKRADAEEKFLSNLDLSGQIIFDIGGWEGIFALYFSRAVGVKGRVIVFEPNPHNCKKIEDNVTLNKLVNVRLEQYAVGSTSGNANLFYNEKVTSRGTLLNSIQMSTNISNGENLAVSVIALDDYVYQNPLDIPDFVKIDVEGFEWEVLRGMSRMLRQHQPDLWIELHDEFLPSKEQSRHEIIKFLRSENYFVYHVETDSFLEVTSPTIPLNGHLYARKSSLKR